MIRKICTVPKWLTITESGDLVFSSSFPRKWYKSIDNLIIIIFFFFRGEGGKKKDLIATAIQIAESSNEVVRLAKLLARECTDRRMRTVSFNTTLVK